VNKRVEAKKLYLAALRGDAVAQRKCSARGKRAGADASQRVGIADSQVKETRLLQEEMKSS